MRSFITISVALLVVLPTAASLAQTQSQVEQANSNPSKKGARKAGPAKESTKATTRAPAVSKVAETQTSAPKSDAAKASKPPRSKPNTGRVQSKAQNTANEPVPIRSRAPSLNGSTGLDRLWAADTGPLETIRMRLGLAFFNADNFPYQGAGNAFVGSYFSFAYTPHKFVEAFTSISATSNSHDQEQPSLLQTQGDLTLGIKSVYPVSDLVRVGGALAARFLSGVGSAGFEPSATSVDLRLLSTFDFTEAEKIPLKIHLELGNYFENSEVLTEHLAGEPSLVQEYGLQVARYDRLTFGLGIESPFDRYFNPFLEYQISKPHFVELARTGQGSHEYTFDSIPHHLTLGLRAFPLEHLAIDTAVRIGLANKPHTGVPATPPYMVLLGVAYTLDPKPKVITKTVEKQVPAPVVAKKTGLFSGRVLDAKSGQPVTDALISYSSMPGFSPQTSASDGRFSGYRFDAGVVEYSVTAKGYKPKQGRKTMSAGQNASVEIKLEIDPAQQAGDIEIRIFGRRGKPVAASLKFGGKAIGQTGRFKPGQPYKAKLPAGRHPLTVTAKGYEVYKTAVLVRGGQTTPLRLNLPIGRPKTGPVSSGSPQKPIGPPKASAGGRFATVTARSISLRRRIDFKPGSSELTPNARAVLNDVARGMKQIKTIKRVRIAAHVSGTGSRDKDSRLSIARANRVKGYLVSRGVAAGRLQARGYGGLKPIRPSLTKRARAQNERVTFTVIRK
ncbi:MAG: OmpA family protein [Myxococcota bacterium]|nr:OmpA family protein [Myxococcota bacterium]